MTADPVAPLLSIEGLGVHYPVGGGLFGRGRRPLRAVDDVSFDLSPGETLALVGESGCGKSSLGRAVMRLAPISAGHIKFHGRSVAGLQGEALRRFRRDVQMIFQDPLASLNPYMPAWQIITEPLLNHGLAERGELRDRASDLFDMVGLSRAHADKYPHQFSGGQRQRLGIARAIAVRPKLIVCDEALAALDVSVQAQVVNLLADLRHELGIAYLFISHDLGVVAHLAERTAVMYLGRLMEIGPTRPMFRAPRHPYTRALVDAVPRMDRSAGGRPGSLAGAVPSPLDPPPGCRFNTRCPFVQPICRSAAPDVSISAISAAACHFAGGAAPPQDALTPVPA